MGKIVIRSKRSPLFSPVSVYELLEVPKVGEKNPMGFFFHCESETIITNKHYFITGFLGDNVVKEKNIVWFCILSNCLAFEQVNRWLESLPFKAWRSAQTLQLWQSTQTLQCVVTLGTLENSWADVIGCFFGFPWVTLIFEHRRWFCMGSIF